jgi:hypothetical protein
MAYSTGSCTRFDAACQAVRSGPRRREDWQRCSAQARDRQNERIAERRLLAPAARHTALLRRADSGQHAAAARRLLAALAERFDSHAPRRCPSCTGGAVNRSRRGRPMPRLPTWKMGHCRRSSSLSRVQAPLVRVPLVHLQHRPFDHHIVPARATSPGLRHALPAPRACCSSGVISTYAHTRIGCRRHARAQAASTSPP